MQETADGIWRWTARHPEWHPGKWGAEMVSYGLSGRWRTFLVDPLAPEGDEEFGAQLEGVVSGPVIVLVTIGYHIRSTEAVSARYPGTVVWGARNAGKRLADRSVFHELGPDGSPPGVRAFHIGRPRRAELPVLVESHAAIAFGDAIVGTGEGLRMWCNQPVDERRPRFYAERFGPSLAPILDEPFDHVLVTHGPAAVGDGQEALRAAVESPPWYHRG